MTGSYIVTVPVLFFVLIGQCLSCCSVSSNQGQKNLPKTRIYTFTIEEGPIAPDGFMQNGILVNGQFPGPTIRVKRNDILTVNVINRLDHGFVVHFHGILQHGSVSSDGVPGITQNEIKPNETYTYTMHIGMQSGTFMYHAHTGLDQNWAFGPLIIEDNPLEFSDVAQRESYSYHSEQIFMLSQLWHVPMASIEAGVTGNPFEDIPETDSLLINGKAHDESNFQVIKVKQNWIYRFRVIGIGMDSMLTFRVENHTMSVIEADGILVDPVSTDHLELNSAQRYSALVKMDQPIGNYWIQTEMITGPGPRNGRAILHYEGAPDPRIFAKINMSGTTPEVELDEWILQKLHPSSSIHQSEVYSVPRKYDREIVIRSHQRNINGFTKFDINGEIYKQDNESPILHQIRNGTNFSASEPSVFELVVGKTIQMVFENRFSDDQECEQHPWHLHGHTFHVVGQGPDEYDPIKAKPIIEQNIVENENQFRDVVTLFANRSDERNSSGTPCGWVAIRFVVNNPGVWLVHCHLTAHMLMGKMFVLYEHTAQDALLSQVS